MSGSVRAAARQVCSARAESDALTVKGAPSQDKTSALAFPVETNKASATDAEMCFLGCMVSHFVVTGGSTLKVIQPISELATVQSTACRACCQCCGGVIAAMR